MYDKDLENKLNVIIRNTEIIPEMRENIAGMKESLKSAHKRIDDFCSELNQSQEKTTKLAERLAIQETICSNNRKKITDEAIIEAAKITGFYRKKSQWIYLFALILVALITLFGQCYIS